MIDGAPAGNGFFRLFCGAMFVCGVCLVPVSNAQSTIPSTGPTEELIALNFPENVEVRVLVDYVSQRLGVNILYDEQAGNQRITLRAPAKIPKASLMQLLESVLRMRSLMLVDTEPAGWKRVVQATGMAAVAQPTTRLTGHMANPNQVVAQIFALRHADVQKVDLLLKPFLTQPGASTLTLPEQRIIVVTDYAANLGRIAGLIDLADQPRKEVVTEFVAVRHVDASQLVQQISQIQSARSKAAGVGPQSAESIELTTEPRTNQLIVVGTLERVQDVLQLAKTLDVKLELEMRTYQLKSASPDRIDRLARELMGPVDVRRLYQSVVDREANLLVVTTTPEHHQRIAALQKDLDKPVAAEQSPIRFYKLTNTTASEVLQTIKAIEGQADLGSASVEGSSSSPNLTKKDDTTFEPVIRGLLPPGTHNASSLSQNPTDSAPGIVGNDPRQGSVDRTRRTVKTKQATITADPTTNSIIVLAEPSVQRIYEQLVKLLDKRRPQVLIECTIVTIDTSNDFALGVEIAGRGAKENTEILSFTSFGLSKADKTSGQLSLEPGLGFNGILIGGDVATLVLRALQTHGRAKVLSAPKILVNDNATGTLASISEQPFASVNASNVVSTTTFGGYASAGTTVTLTPHIAEGDHLQLEYSIALNSFTGQGSANVPPPRQTDTVTSKVTIPDGHTIIVGGLHRAMDSTSLSTVPGVGQIPILRELFTSRSRKDSNSSLFVFIRPIILRDDQFEDLKFFSQRDSRAAGIAEEFPESEPLSLP